MRTLYLLFSVTVLVLISGCSNQKNTFVSRNYHNLTAHYNVYFNGKEAYKAGLKSIEDNHKEDFTKLLPVFLYDDKDALSAVSGDMSIAIEKATKLVTKHSITRKPKKKPQMSQKQKEFYAQKEFCKWVDDAYMLKGKAYFYQSDYLSAQRNFSYMLTRFKDKPESYPAKLWVVRCKIQSGYKEDAVEMLQKLDDDVDFPEKLQVTKDALWTDVLIKQQKYSDAINHLDDAVKLVKRKKVKVRWLYLLAQLNRKIGDDERAYELFVEVSKMNVNYEMEFNAKISLATSFPSKSGNTAEIIKLLNKLLRDAKNVDYHDQIYYALAELEAGKGNSDKALDLYKKSVETSVGNDQQKAISFLSAADIYYGRKDYINAQPYYDSCVGLLREDFEDYELIKTKSKHLNFLAENYNTVSFQDSVQRLAKMDKKELNLFISDLIEKVKEQEELERQLAAQQQLESQQYREDFGMNNTKASSFYFYNPQLVARGKDEFFRKWGNRPNEDDWRRSNKKVVSWDEFEEDETDDEEGVKEEEISNKNPKFYLRNIPVGDSLMAVSHAKIIDALYNIGTTFQEYIVEPEQAVWAYEEIVRRYPDYESLPGVYYSLYRLCEEYNMPEKAEKYRLAIINEYPNTRYAQAMSDPNFFRDLKAAKLKVERKYKRAYIFYLNEDFASALNICNETDTAFNENHLEDQFSFIKAMSLGKLGGVSIMKKQLEQFKDSSQNTELNDMADKIIGMIIDQQITEESLKSTTDSAQISETVKKKVEELQEEEKEIYFFEPESKHYLLMVGENEFVDPQRLRFNLLNYNLEYFSNFDFDISVINFTDKVSFVTVGTLKNSRQAKNYYDLIGINPQIFENLEKDNIEYVLISEKNLTTLKEDKRLDRYMSFYFDWYSQL